MVVYQLNPIDYWYGWIPFEEVLASIEYGDEHEPDYDPTNSGPEVNWREPCLLDADELQSVSTTPL
jgi:hypothetical protein